MTDLSGAADLSKLVPDSEWALLTAQDAHGQTWAGMLITAPNSQHTFYIARTPMALVTWAQKIHAQAQEVARDMRVAGKAGSNGHAGQQ